MDAFWSEHKVKVKSFKITRSFFDVVNDCARHHCDSDSCSLHLYCLIFFNIPLPNFTHLVFHDQIFANCLEWEKNQNKTKQITKHGEAK